MNTVIKKHSASVSHIMMLVMLASLPGLITMTMLLGWGIIIHVLIACIFGLLFETIVLHMRKQPMHAFLWDGSTVVTAMLLAIALPPLLPWWQVAIGMGFAIIIAKHLYGGIGCNIFNPAMIGYVVLLISYPKTMSLWPDPLHVHVSLAETLKIIFHFPSDAPMDTLTQATPIDMLDSKLKQGKDALMALDNLYASPWLWINLAWLFGGLLLGVKRLVNWPIPIGLLLALASLAALLHSMDASRFAPMIFHLFSGMTMAGAFFIATDPVTSPSSTVAKWVYGIMTGILIYLIRVFASYPDGIAFAILLMNAATPLLDILLRPRAYGH